MLRVGHGRLGRINRGAADLAFTAGLKPAAWFRFGLGIVSANGLVSQWSDASGNGRHLLQATETNMPALQADGSILFDGVDNFLACDDFTLNQPTSVYILYQSVSYTSGRSIFGGGSLNVMLLQQFGTTPALRIFAGSGVASNTNHAVGAYGVDCAVFNGASSLLQVNNTAATTGNAGASNAGGFQLAADGDGSNPSNIQCKEVIIYAAAHDAATRQRVIRYLGQVGGIAV